MENNKKSTVKWSIILISVVGLLFIGLFLGIFCFTINLAKFTYTCGFYSISSNLYDLEYRKSDNINYIAKSCNIDIECKNYGKYLNHYQKFVADKEYLNYIEFINNKNYNNNKLSILSRSSLINEDNYYKNKYVLALIKNQKYKNAIEYAIANSKIDDQVNYLEPGIYLYANIINDEQCQKILVQDDKVFILDKILLYYMNLVNHYSEIKDKQDLNNIYFLYYCNYTISIGNDILKVDASINIIDEKEENQINQNILILNNSITSVLED